MKKTALASAIALATLASGAAWAETTTIGGSFVFDRTEVAAGEKINIAILGLNAQGEVDTQGDASGSTIMADVRTVKGEICGGGSDTRGAPWPGYFAASTRFVELKQGLGRVFICYPAEANGTDTVEITLMEQFQTTSGATDYKNITNAQQPITISPVPTDPGGLAIASFMPSDSDSHGMASECSGLWSKDCGISGQMTAGQSGGKVMVKAKNPHGAGTVKLTLTYKGHMMPGEEAPTHSYTANMVAGEATVTLDGQVTKAGEYFVEAMIEGTNNSSVGLVYPDMLKVWSTGEPKKLKLWADKQRIANPDFTQTITNDQIKQGTWVKGYLLDAYGNMTSNCVPEKNEDTGGFECTAGGEIRVAITDNSGSDDLKAIVDETKLDLHIPANSADGMTVAKTGDATLGNQAGELGWNSNPSKPKTGTVKLVATAKDSSGNAITAIANSDPVEIKVVEKSLSATALFTTEQIAGNQFKGFEVAVIGSAGQTVGNAAGIVVKNTHTMEDNETAPDTEKKVTVQFKKQTWGYKQYLISDKVGNYAQVLVDAGSIGPAKVTKVEFQNAHGQQITEVAPAPITADKKYIVRIPEAAFKLFDEYGNMKTGAQPLTAGITGTFTASTSNATSIGYMSSNNAGVPGRLENIDGKPSHAHITYDATGSKKFAGGDTIKLAFTEARLFPFSLATTIPGYSGLASIKSYLQAIENKVPVNSEVAMTVEVMDGDGKRFVDPDPDAKTSVTVTINGQEGDNVNPTVTEIWWKMMAPLSETDCTAAGGTFADGMCQLTEEQCKAQGGTLLLHGHCMERMERQVGNGDTLDFAETMGRKVFALNAGSEKGQFSVTFTSADANGNPITETRTLLVTKTEPPKCEPGSTDEKLKCNYADQCQAAMGIFANSQCFAASPLSAASLYDGSYPATGRAAFSGGLSVVGRDDASYLKTQTISRDNLTRLAGVIKADPDDVGESADIFVGAIHAGPQYAEGYAWYKLIGCEGQTGCPSRGWNARVWQHDKKNGMPLVGDIGPYKKLDSLPEYYTVKIPGASLPPDLVAIVFGYIVTSGNREGEIIYSPELVVVTVQ